MSRRFSPGWRQWLGQEQYHGCLGVFGDVVKQGRHAEPGLRRFCPDPLLQISQEQRTTTEFALVLELDGAVYDYHLIFAHLGRRAAD